MSLVVMLLTSNVNLGKDIKYFVYTLAQPPPQPGVKSDHSCRIVTKSTIIISNINKKRVILKNELHLIIITQQNKVNFWLQKII